MTMQICGILSCLKDEAYSRDVKVQDEQTGELTSRPMLPAELLVLRLREKIPPGAFVNVSLYTLQVGMVDDQGTLLPHSYEGLKLFIDLYEGLKLEIEGWPMGKEYWQSTNIRSIEYLAVDSGTWNHVVCSLQF